MMRVLLTSLFLLAGTVAVAQDAPSAVVRFEKPCAYNGRIATCIGSGVHIGNGFILTAQHVVDKETTIPFQLKNSRTFHTAEVLWSNYDYDIALVRAPMEDLPALTLDCGVPPVSEPVTSIGNLHGLRWFVSKGHVATEPDKLARWLDVYALSGPIAGGMSGGPVIDAASNIVGIVVAGPESEAFGFAVPGRTICKLLGRVR